LFEKKKTNGRESTKWKRFEQMVCLAAQIPELAKSTNETGEE